MFYLINKPKGYSSYKLIIILRKKLGLRKIGHAGTLDPMGQGLMILAVGKDSTKKISSLIKKDKTYEFEITLGKKTTTLDETGEVVKSNESVVPIFSQVKKEVRNMEGDNMQTPPQYSAIKVNGKRAYKLARKNIKVKLKSRKIKVYSIKLLSYSIQKQGSVAKYHRALTSGCLLQILGRNWEPMDMFHSLKELRLGIIN